MHKIQELEIIENINIAKDVYKMQLKIDTSFIKKPGEFINIEVKDAYLKRPISISDYTKDSLTIIYKVVGFGTNYLKTLKENDVIKALVGLGNGFDINKDLKEVILVGGGVGVPPLYKLAKELLKNGVKVNVLLGFANVEDVFYENEFKALGCNVYVATMDGTYGEKGNVVNLMNNNDLSDLYYYACGPEKMLKALMENSTNKGQLSFEARMGCGFGACMGCSCKTISGYKRICKEGPVMNSEDILWQD